MKYPTGIGAFISSVLIDMKCYMLQKDRTAFNYLECNYRSIHSASGLGPTFPRRFSRFSCPTGAARIVHNLCINWQ